MPLYEHVFLARQDASPQQVEELIAQIKGVVEQMGGKVAKTESWGIRSLTYRMNKNRKAHFTLLNIDGPAAIVAEVERQERIHEDVIRYLTVRVDELEDGPSAMMRKSERDRDERGERGFGGGGFGGGFRGDRDRGRSRRSSAAPSARRRNNASLRRPGSKSNGHGCKHPASPVLPPQEDLPVHRHERAEDRLQGSQAARALRVRARQDRAEPHHRGLCQEAA